MSGVAQILERFEENPALWANAIRDRIKSDPDAFCEDAVRVLRQTVDNGGFRTHSASSKALTLILCDPELLTEEQARRLAARLKNIGLVFERSIFERVFGADGAGGMSVDDPSYGLRFLQIFGEKTNSARLLSVMGGLLRHPNAKIRSKATVIAGKVTHRFDWVDQTRQAEDERVRANALEALWQPGVPEQCRSTLWASVNDSNNRVAGNALLGLYRYGDAGCIPLIAQMATHADEKFRATAAWVIGQTEDERFRERLMVLREDPDELIRQNAAQALKKLDDRKAAVSERVQLLTFSSGGATASKAAFHAAAVSAQGQPLPALKPTDFLIWRNGAAVENYTITRRRVPEGISVAFAFPAVDTHHKDLRRRWASILTECFRQKRRLDHWGLLEYGDAQEPAGQKKPVFVRNSLQLEDFLGSMTRSAQTAGFFDALEALLTPPTFVRTGPPARKESLHAVMIDLACKREYAPEQVAALKEAAANNEFVVHGISADRTSALAELAEATGGIFLVSQGRIENAGREMLTVYNALLLNYRIEFESSEEGQVKLGVRQGALSGEVKVGERGEDGPTRAVSNSLEAASG